jgi:uncharacterized protein (TIGR00255 family)
MIQSMTGYGKADCEFQNKKITVEVKALNSKQFDLNLKVPSVYKEKELEIRNELIKELERGKVDFYISVDSLANCEDTGAVLNANIIKGYYVQILGISKDLGVEVPPDILNVILRMPEVLKSEKQELSDEEWQQLHKCVRKAIGSLLEFRKQEGKALSEDIVSRVTLIKNLADELEKYENVRIEKVKARIHQNLEEIIVSEKIDKNRFEEELIYYLEKFDITEEKVRLANHCSYFMETLGDKESVGKKLGFITQEIGREINTIGSKSNDADMQKIVVKMKDELEKIKEQINNVL